MFYHGEVFFLSKLNILNILLLRDVAMRTYVIPAIFLLKSYKISKLNKGFLHLNKHYLVAIVCLIAHLLQTNIKIIKQDINNLSRFIPVVTK